MIETAIVDAIADEIAAKPTGATLIHAVCSRGYALVPIEVLDRFPEINPSNYDHSDACKLNAWGVELVNAATR